MSKQQKGRAGEGEKLDWRFYLLSDDLYGSFKLTY